MVQFIGNSIHFNGKGILDGKLVLPNRSGVIGNGSLFKAFLPFSAGTFANASDRYITAKNPTTGLYEITGPFGSNVLATRNISGDTYGQFFRQVTEDINNEAGIEDYSDSMWQDLNNVAVTTNQTNSPLGTLTADLLYATGSGSLAHSKRAFGITLIANQPNTHGAFFKNNTAGGVGLTAYVGSQQYIKYSFITNSIEAVSGGYLLDYGKMNLTDDWVFLWICYYVPSDQGTYRYHQLLDANLDTNYDQAGESYYFWGGTDEKNARYPSFLKLAIGTYTPDYFYFPSSAIPTWMKSKFTMKLIPAYDFPSDMTEDKPLWSFNKTASTLASGEGYHGMDADSTNIYWAQYGGSGKIRYMPIGGGSITDLATAQNNPTDVKVNATTAYWVERGANKIRSIPLGGGSITDVLTGLTSPFALAITATEIYFSSLSAGKIQKAPIGGGAVSDVITGLSNPTGVAVDSTYVYYVDASGAIKKSPLAGGTAVTLATGQSNVQFITIDDYFVYWGDYGHNVVKCVSKNGGAIATLVDETGAHSVALLNGALFWSGSSNVIKRRDSVTAWLTTTGTIKVVEGPTTMIETSAATASMHDNLEVEFDRANGKITLSGFTSGDGECTDTSWTSPDGFDVQYGCALGGAAQSGALVTTPKG